MPDNFKSKNGATLAGHSSKWSNDNRRTNSHDAGNGSRASRNQGRGMQGKLNTMPSTGIDTTKMNPNDKLKYFKSLGLMPGSEPTPEPEVQKDPVHNDRNKVQALTQDLQKVFQAHPNYLHSIVQQLKSVPKEKFKDAVFAAYRAMQETTSKPNIDPKIVLSTIQDAIDNSSTIDEAVLDEDYGSLMTRLMDKLRSAIRVKGLRPEVAINQVTRGYNDSIRNDLLQAYEQEQMKRR